MLRSRPRVERIQQEFGRVGISFPASMFEAAHRDRSSNLECLELFGHGRNISSTMVEEAHRQISH